MPLAVRIAAEGFHPPLLAKVAKKRRAGELVAVSKRGRVRADGDKFDKDHTFAIAIDDHEIGDRVSLQRRGIVNVEYITEDGVKLGTPLAINDVDPAKREFKFKKAGQGDTVYAFVVEHVRQAGHSYTRIMMTPGYKPGVANPPANEPASQKAKDEVARLIAAVVAISATALTEGQTLIAANAMVDNTVGEVAAKKAAVQRVKEAYETYNSAIMTIDPTKDAEFTTWIANLKGLKQTFNATVIGDYKYKDAFVAGQWRINGKLAFLEQLGDYVLTFPDGERFGDSAQTFFNFLRQFTATSLKSADHNCSDVWPIWKKVATDRVLFTDAELAGLAAASTFYKAILDDLVNAMNDGANNLTSAYANIQDPNDGNYAGQLAALKGEVAAVNCGELVELIHSERARATP